MTLSNMQQEGRRSETETPGKAASGNPAAAPVISLPKGGGAIRGIGEKFAANPVTGTGSLSIPIFTSPGRSNFSPQLSLSYDSGAGNGPFGFGWQLSVPAISRKTDKGLPRYQDDDESDVFILSGAEDLVPVLSRTNSRETLPKEKNGIAYTVYRYRPRIEGLFARIERWRNNKTGGTHWRSISKDNITSIYGEDLKSQVADPDDTSHVFVWLLEKTYDDKGNVMVYEYKAEDQNNVAPSLHEHNHKFAGNRYLMGIKYGNRLPYYPNDGSPQPSPLPTGWLFRVEPSYG